MSALFMAHFSDFNLLILLKTSSIFSHQAGFQSLCFVWDGQVVKRIKYLQSRMNY